MIDRFVSAARASGLDLDARELADALWLAVQRERAGYPRADGEDATARELDSAPGGPAESAAQAARNQPSTTPRAPQGETVTVPEHLAAGVYAAEPAAGDGGERRASRVDVARVSPLPNARELGRALRPLMRRFRSMRRPVLDEEATVQMFGRTSVLSPVFAPGRERWYEVALVFDASPSMTVWAETERELARMLARHGAFRLVRRYRLRLAGPEPLLESATGLLARPSELRDPHGRTLILVLTDCVDDAWRSDAAWSALADWSASTALALVQLLPERVWGRTGLGAARVRLSSHRPGARGRDLTARSLDWWDEPGPRDARVPVVTLEEHAFAALADVLMGAGGARVPGVTLPRVPSDDAATLTDDLTGDELVESFLQSAHPVAQELAIYFSAVPLRLPIMGLVQRSLLPASHQVDLAEVFVSGLIRRVSSAAVADRDAVYEFKDGVRDRLLRSLTISGTHRVLEAVSSYLQERLGQALSFGALVDDPSGIERLPAEARPFAQLAARALARLRPGKQSSLVGATRTRKEERFEHGLSVRQRLAAQRATHVAWSHDGGRIALISGLEVRAFDARSGAERGHWKPDAKTGAVAIAWEPGNDEAPMILWYDASGDQLSVRSAAGSTTILSWTSSPRVTGAQLAYDPLSASPIVANGSGESTTVSNQARREGFVAIAATDEVVAMLGLDELVVMRAAETSGYKLGQPSESVPVRARFAVALSGDGSRVALHRAPGELHLAATFSEDELERLEVPIDGACQLSLSHDGNLLAARADDGMLRIWRTDTLEKVLEVQHPGADLAFSPTAPQLALALEGEVLILTVDEAALSATPDAATHTDRALLVEMRLERGDADLAELAEFLAAPVGGGVPDDAIIRLHQPDLAELRAQVDALVRAGAGARRLYLHIGGEFTRDGLDQRVLLGRGREQFLLVDDVVDRLESSGAREVVAWIDGPTSRSDLPQKLLTGNLNVPSAASLVLRQEFEAEESLARLTLRGLTGAAAHAGREWIGADELASFVTRVAPRVEIRRTGEFDLVRAPQDLPTVRVELGARALLGRLELRSEFGETLQELEAPGTYELELAPGLYEFGHFASGRERAFAVEPGGTHAIHLTARVVVVFQSWDESAAALATRLRPALEESHGLDPTWDEPETEARTLRAALDGAQALLLLVGSQEIDMATKNRITLALEAAEEREVPVLPVVVELGAVPTGLSDDFGIIRVDDHEDTAALVEAIESTLASDRHGAGVLATFDESVPARMRNVLVEQLQRYWGVARVRVDPPASDREGIPGVLASITQVVVFSGKAVRSTRVRQLVRAAERGHRSVLHAALTEDDATQSSIEEALSDDQVVLRVGSIDRDFFRLSRIADRAAPLPAVRVTLRPPFATGDLDVLDPDEKLIVSAPLADGVAYAELKPGPYTARAGDWSEPFDVSASDGSQEFDLRPRGPFVWLAHSPRESGADALIDRLRGALGVARTSTLGSGDLARPTIPEHDVFVGIVGPGWFLGGQGAPFRDPQDQLAGDFRAAIGAGVPAMFVLVDGAKVPEPDAFPEDLAPLADLLPMTYEQESDIEGIVETIDTVAAAREGAWMDEQELEHVQQRIADLRALADSEGDEVLPDLADALIDLAQIHMAASAAGPAVGAAQEAAEVQDAIHTADPDADLPALAWTRTTLAHAYHQMGQDEEALRAALEARDIRRRHLTARPQDPDRIEGLAAATEHAAGLAPEGSTERFLLTAKAVKLRGTQAETDFERHGLAYARALLDLARQRGSEEADADREPPAGAAREAVEVFRRVGEGVEGELASALRMFTAFLDAEKDAQELVEASMEAVDIRRRELARDESHERVEALAHELHAHADTLHRSRDGRSLEAAEEAQELFGRLEPEPEFEEAGRWLLAKLLIDLHAESGSPSVSFDLAFVLIAELERLYPNDEDAREFIAETAAHAQNIADEFGVDFPPGLAAHVSEEPADAARRLDKELDEARSRGDVEDVVRLTQELAGVRMRLGEHDLAVDLLREALPAAQRLGRPTPEIALRSDLGLALLNRGDAKGALEPLERALDSARSSGDRAREREVTARLGSAFAILGEVEAARARFEEAVGLARELGDRASEAVHLYDLGHAHELLGDLENALQGYEQTVVAATAVGDRRLEARALRNAGDVLTTIGSGETALAKYDEALAAARDIGDPLLEDHILRSRGDSLVMLGRPAEAIDSFELALDLARRADDRVEEQKALAGLGAASAALRLTVDALRHYRAAHAIARDLGDERSAERYAEALRRIKGEFEGEDPPTQSAPA